MRIVAATNKDIRRTVESGKFREDLYYRLNVATIRIPPLRDRRDDILPLAECFLREFSGTFGKSMVRIDPEASDRLLAYDWKGNVREVRNAIERIVLLEEGDTLKPEHLDFIIEDRREAPASEEAQGRTFTLPPEGVVLDELNRDLIEQALAVTGGNQVRAAKLLDLTRGTLRYRLDKYNIRD